MSDSFPFIDHADKLSTESVTGGSEQKPAKDTEPPTLPLTSGCQGTIAVDNTLVSVCSDETLWVGDVAGSFDSGHSSGDVVVLVIGAAMDGAY